MNKSSLYWGAGMLLAFSVLAAFVFEDTNACHVYYAAALVLFFMGRANE